MLLICSLEIILFIWTPLLILLLKWGLLFESGNILNFIIVVESGFSHPIVIRFAVWDGSDSLFELVDVIFDFPLLGMCGIKEWFVYFCGDCGFGFKVRSSALYFLSDFDGIDLFDVEELFIALEGAFGGDESFDCWRGLCFYCGLHIKNAIAQNL